MTTDRSRDTHRRVATPREGVAGRRPIAGDRRDIATRTRTRVDAEARRRRAKRKRIGKRRERARDGEEGRASGAKTTRKRRITSSKIFESRREARLVKLNSRISNVDLIENIYVQEFNKDYVNLKIKYLGKLEKIINQLKNENINLRLVNDQWLISTM